MLKIVSLKHSEYETFFQMVTANVNMQQNKTWKWNSALVKKNKKKKNNTLKCKSYYTKIQLTP